MADKAPSFPRYPQDFLSSPDCRSMTLEEYGAYNMLLDLSWVSSPQCYLPKDPKTLASLLHISVEKFHAIWRVVGRKFRTKGEHIFNPRLLQERAKQRRRYRQAVENGKAGGRPRKTRPVSQKKPQGAETQEKPLSSSSSISFSRGERTPPTPSPAGNGSGPPGMASHAFKSPPTEGPFAYPEQPQVHELVDAWNGHAVLKPQPSLVGVVRKLLDALRGGYTAEQIRTAIERYARVKAEPDRFWGGVPNWSLGAFVTHHLPDLLADTWEQDFIDFKKRDQAERDRAWDDAETSRSGGAE